MVEMTIDITTMVTIDTVVVTMCTEEVHTLEAEVTEIILEAEAEVLILERLKVV